MTIKAVVFDLGGVCVGSPLHAINEYEKILGVPHNFFNYMIAHWKSPSPMNRLELGEWDTISPEFLKLFHEHLNDAEGYHAFFSSPFCPKDAVEGRPPTVDGMELWRRMIEASSVVNTELIKVIQQLRASGKYKVWALTNNFPGDFGAPVVALFDRVVGSVQMKMRKPDPRLYKYLIKELDLPSEEIVFLDDIGANLKAARKLGINTIQVDFRTTPVAIEKLYTILGQQETKARL